MKSFVSIVAASLVVCGSLAVAGCESMHHSDSSTHHAETGGGNGAFGESPAKPGAYGTSGPASQGGTGSGPTGAANSGNNGTGTGR